MEFLYPFFTNPTHKITIEEAPNKKQYNGVLLASEREYSLPKNINVSMIEHGVGNKFNLSKVKLIDESYRDYAFYNQEVYVRTSDLLKTSSKTELQFTSSKQDRINTKAPELNYLNYETFVPFVDTKIGMLCVRIETDYDKLLNSILLAKVYQEVLREGIKNILQFKGFAINDAVLDRVENEYVNFGYILKSDDLVSIRPCQNITFTVGVPLRYLSQFNFVKDVEEEESVRAAIDSATKFIYFNSSTIIDEFNKLQNVFLNKNEEYTNYINSLKVFDSFILNTEINSLNLFLNNFIELLNFIEQPLNTETNADYTIGLNDNLEVLYVRVASSNVDVAVARQTLNKFVFRDSFSSKRILNYLLLKDQILSFGFRQKLTDFIQNYVNYPKSTVRTIEIDIAGKTLSEATVSRLTQAFKDSSEKCFTSTDALSDVVNPLYHLFVSDPKVREKLKKEPKLETQKEEAAASSNRNDNFKIEFNFSKTFVNELGIDQRLLQSEEEFKNDMIRMGITDSTRQNAYKSIGYLNTTYAILNRLNITKIFMEHIFCLLKSSDPNDQRLAEILSKAPDLLTYLIYSLQLYSTNDPNLLINLVNRFPINFNLFCTANASTAYWIKSVLQITKSGINFTRDINNALGNIEFDTNRIKELMPNKGKVLNPYQTLASSFVSIVVKLVTDFAAEIIYEAFKPSCDEDFLDVSQEGINIFDTSNQQNLIGNQRSSLTASSNNKNTERKNKINKSISQTLPDTFSYVENETVVNLLDLLLKDIRCILTPIELSELLRGNPTTEVINIIKSLVRKKYSPELIELLNTSRLVDFFANLGENVDQSLLNNLTTGATDLANQFNLDINNPATVSLFCSPIQLKARQDIVDGKMPDLPKIADINAKRIQKIVNLLENNNALEPDQQLLADALCDNDEPNESAQVLIEAARAYNDSLFSNLHSTFLTDADLINKKITDEKVIIYDFEEGNKKAFFQYADHSIQAFSSKNCLRHKTEIIDNVKKISKITITKHFTDDIGIFSNMLDMIRNKNGQYVANSPDVCKQQNVTTPDNWFLEDRYLHTAFFVQTDLDSPTLIDTIKTQDAETSIIVNRFVDNFYSSNDFKGRIFDKNLFIAFEVEDNNLSASTYRISYFYRLSTGKYLEIHKAVQNISDNDKAEDVYNEDATFTSQKFYSTSYFTKVVKEPNDADYGLLNKKSFQINNSVNTFIRKSIKDFYDKFIVYKNNESEAYKKFLELTNFEFFTIEIIENNYEFIDFKLYDNKKTLLFHINQSDDAFEDFKQIFKHLEDKEVFANEILKTYLNLIYYTSGILFKSSTTYSSPTVFKNKNINYVYQNYLDLNLNSLFEGRSFGNYEGTQNYLNSKTPDSQRLVNNNKLINLNVEPTLEQRNCNIYPHYLNIDSLKKIILNSVKGDVCQGLINTVDNFNKEAIVILTFRAYIAELMQKAMPHLMLSTKQTLENLYTNKLFIEFLYSIMKNQMVETYGLYYQTEFFKSSKLIFKNIKDCQDDKCLTKYYKKFDRGFALDNEIKYFISREVNYYIKFCERYLSSNFTGGMEKPEEQSIYLQEIDKRPFKPFDRLPYTFSNSYLKYYNQMMIFAYMIDISYNSVSSLNNNMYRDTKNELFNLFGNSFDKQYLETPDQKELEEYQFNLRQFDALEDITKQTIAIAKSPNPNLFARSIENLFGSKTNENYSFLLNAILKNNLAMLKQVATLSDPTMYFTEKSLGFASTIPFILLSNLETEQRNRFVAESGRLLGSYYINIVNGNKISPVIVPYAASAIFLPSTPVGWLYSAADVIDWSVEYYKSIKEWDSLVINSEKIKEDPCTPPNIIETNSLQCSPEKRTKLLEEFGYYEKENE